MTVAGPGRVERVGNAAVAHLRHTISLKRDPWNGYTYGLFNVIMGQAWWEDSRAIESRRDRDKFRTIDHVGGVLTDNSELSHGGLEFRLHLGLVVYGTFM